MLRRQLLTARDLPYLGASAGLGRIVVVAIACAVSTLLLGRAWLGERQGNQAQD
jgi:hypothetical protein